MILTTKDLTSLEKFIKNKIELNHYVYFTCKDNVLRIYIYI